MGDHYKTRGNFIDYAEKFPDWARLYNLIKRIIELMRGCLAVVAGLFASSALQGTFSIVAYDPATGDIGVAVQSRVLGVGSIVLGQRLVSRQLATQALANVRLVQMVYEGCVRGTRLRPFGRLF